jgi:hypothetical protein
LIYQCPSRAEPLLTLGGYLLEQFAVGQAGLVGLLEHPLPVAGMSDALAILGRSGALNFGYMCAGWAIASAIYRWGNLSGLVAIPVVAVPVLLANSLADFSFLSSLALSAGLDPQEHPVQVGIGNTLAVALRVGALAALVVLVVRRSPLQAVKS